MPPPKSLQCVPIGFIGPFLCLHFMAASSYVFFPNPYGRERFQAMWSPVLNGTSPDDDDFVFMFFHFWQWYSFLLGLLRLYGGVGVIMQNDSAIHMAMLSYLHESMTYLPLVMMGYGDPENTFLPAYATIFGFIVMIFRQRPVTPIKIE